MSACPFSNVTYKPFLQIFDSGLERLTCLAILKSYDTTRQSVCEWQYIYLSLIIRLRESGSTEAKDQKKADMFTALHFPRKAIVMGPFIS